MAQLKIAEPVFQAEHVFFAVQGARLSVFADS